ncbi:TPA: DCL family protein [Vibrio vulnificus]|nr:DUF3223 domain-containing protein [Vibrio vulnificus]HDY7562916.1 DCL family protein [Vibrio vulnificus]
MGKKQPIELPSIKFDSKREAITFFKEMLNKYEDRETLNDTDTVYLYELLMRHPKLGDKWLVGIKRFYKDKAKDYPTKCFHLERVDDSTSDFSYLDCINGTDRTPFNNFYNACRSAISERLIKEKTEIFKFGNVHCFKTGELLSINDCEYRHVEIPFKEIIDRFIQAKDLTISNDLIVEDADMQYATRFKSIDLAREFDAHHKSIAVLKCFKKYVK